MWCQCWGRSEPSVICAEVRSAIEIDADLAELRYGHGSSQRSSGADCDDFAGGEADQDGGLRLNLKGRLNLRLFGGQRPRAHHYVVRFKFPKDDCHG